MAFLQTVSELESNPGVRSYIVTDKEGHILASDPETPENLAGVVKKCANNLDVLTKGRFDFAVFTRKSAQDFLIFLVGNCYLGVIKQEEIKINTLIETIKEFLLQAKSVNGHEEEI